MPVRASSRPNRLRQPTPQTIVKMIQRPRRQRWSASRSLMEVGISPATVSRLLRLLGPQQAHRALPVDIRIHQRDMPGYIEHDTVGVVDLDDRKATPLLRASPACIARPT